MKQEIIENIEDNELTDPIGDLRRALNQEMPSRDEFHKMNAKLKNLPMFFDLAKKRCEQ